MSARRANFICIPDDRPGPRGTDCPDPLHDHPLPAGYCEASDEADRRLASGWDNRACPRCGLYGWEPPALAGAAAPQPPNPEETSRG